MPSADALGAALHKEPLWGSHFYMEQEWFFQGYSYLKDQTNHKLGVRYHTLLQFQLVMRTIKPLENLERCPFSPSWLTVDLTARIPKGRMKDDQKVRQPTAGHLPSSLSALSAGPGYNRWGCKQDFQQLGAPCLGFLGLMVGILHDLIYKNLGNNGNQHIPGGARFVSSTVSQGPQTRTSNLRKPVMDSSWKSCSALSKVPHFASLACI